MKHKETLGIKNLLFLGLGLSAAIGLKYYYRRAGADDLLWILQPTATLVQGITGMDFVHESGAGFVSGDRRIVIAPACAGINFLIIAFCLGCFSFMHWFGSMRKKCGWLAVSGIGAYSAALAVNTLRIILSIYTYGAQIQYGWLTAERIHRLEGVVVYFSGLILYQNILKGAAVRLAAKRGNVTADIRKGFARRILSSPLCWYCAVALGVPLINLFGDKQSPLLWEHCGMVVGVCAFVMILKFHSEKIKKLNFTRIAQRIKQPKGKDARNHEGGKTCGHI